jgi:hypothetical protein
LSLIINSWLQFSLHFTWLGLSVLSFISSLVKVESADSVEALWFLRASRFAWQLVRMPTHESCTLNYC